MMDQIRDVLTRSRETILEDMIGVVALGVMLFGSLTLPGLF